MSGEENNSVKAYLSGWMRSFAVQLLVLHIRNRSFFLIPWILLVLWMTSSLQWDYGIPLLFLEPEYLGKEWFMSYFFLGTAFGALIMSWHITTYLLESFRFPFMGNLKRPFAMFCLNNSVIPLFIIILYMVCMINFENKYPEFNVLDLMGRCLGFFTGIALIFLLSAIYFQSTNHNVYKFLDKTIEPKIENWADKMQLHENYKWRVDTYFSFRFKTRITRELENFNSQHIQEVFKQHHYNFFIVQCIILTSFFILGFLVEFPFFQIPAACSLVLLMAFIIALGGLFRFMTNRWSTLIFTFILLLINYSSKLGLSLHDNYAYGLDYTKKLSYSQAYFDEIQNGDSVEMDIQNTMRILDKWKQKQIPRADGKKPKMIIITASGGGLTSTLFSTAVLQECNKALSNQLFQKTTLMTGASGGVIGLSYMRELYLQSIQNAHINISDNQYALNIAQDLLNPMCVTNLTHDLLFPIRKFKYNNFEYRKDRAYMFEWKLNQNSGGILSKKISEYTLPERDALIPLVFNSSTIVNDYKQFIVSAQPIRYMMQPYSSIKKPDNFETDMIDYCTFFDELGGRDIKLTTALRMTATYPFILPSVVMPTYPQVAAMDGGMRDNNGSQIIFKFIDVFHEWIKENTDGVVVVQIKYFPKFRKIEGAKYPSFFEKFFSPVGKIYSNVFKLQDYQQDQLMNVANHLLDGKLDVVRFEYDNQLDEKEASLSFHLTKNEKEHILRSSVNNHNQRSIEKLKRVMNEQ